MPAAVSADDEHAPLMARFEQLPRLVNDDADLVRRGAWVDLQFQVGLGAVPYHLTVAGGRITGLDRGPILMRPSRFQISATAEAWRRFWQPLPEPGLARPAGADQARRGTHRRRSAAAAGQPAVLQGRAGGTASPGERGALMPAQLEPIVGRYMSLVLEGRAHRVYFEEAGAGHPAGVPAHRRRRRPAVPPSDARRGDHPPLSACSRSTCPGTASRCRRRAGEREEYRLTTAAYTEMVLAFCEALELAAAGGDGLLDRRTHRAQPRHRARARASAR